MGGQGQLDCGLNLLDHLHHFLNQPSEALEELNAFESVDRMLGLALDSENRMKVVILPGLEAGFLGHCFVLILDFLAPGLL